jgi:hypothetical protein
MEGPLVDVSATTAQKIATAKEKKEAGDQAFKRGNSRDGMLTCTL